MLESKEELFFEVLLGQDHLADQKFKLRSRALFQCIGFDLSRTVAIGSSYTDFKLFE